MYEDKQKKFKGECMITYASTEGADSAVKFLNGMRIECITDCYCLLFVVLLYSIGI